MISVYVPEVGDGLAAGIRAFDDVDGVWDIQIDCGSTQHPDWAFHKGLCQIRPEVFVLSNFHYDHYNGLLNWSGHPDYPRLHIRRVFFPRIPDFSEKKEFISCLFAMAKWVMGDSTGDMAADFLNIIRTNNYGPFEYRALAQGDTVQIGGSQLEVIWPPREVDNGTLKAIKKAIRDFGEATERDETLARVRKRIGERREIDSYLRESEGRDIIMEGRGEDRLRREKSPFVVEPRELPEHIAKANQSLRDAANLMSLAFHMDNKILSMGDLEKTQIKQVVELLVNKGRNRFQVMITPHHGTHWDDAFRRLQCGWALGSVGGGLFRHVKPEFKSICDQFLITHLQGDIEIPVSLRPDPYPWRWRHRRHWWSFS